MAADFVLKASLEKVKFSWTNKANRQDISLPGQQSTSSKQLQTTE